MRADQAREIAVHKYLETEGIQPDKIRKDGMELWYKSPIREGDKTPSFSVDIPKNCWYDQGIGKGGNVIDLVCAHKNVSVSQALAILERSNLSQRNAQPPDNQNLPLFRDLPLFSSSTNKIDSGSNTQKIISANEKEKGTAFEILKVMDIQHPALVQYLEKRKISLSIAKQYLKEIRFKPPRTQKQFFALGWPSGQGYDVRNALFKGFVGKGKDITEINLKNGNDLYIFEGFIDFLSWLTWNRIDEFKDSAIVLNTASLKKKALDRVLTHQFDRIFLCLDNDEAGKYGTEFFKEHLKNSSVVDKSVLYAKFKDFNEMVLESDTKSPPLLENRKSP